MHCFGCSNLISKSYCIWNKQYSREEYFSQLEKLNIGSYADLEILKKRFIEEIYLSSVHRYANIFNSVDSTGDNINNAKNAKYCFDIFRNVEDSKYLYSALDLKDSYDGNGVFENELSYEFVDCNTGNRNLGCIIVYESTNVSYALNCHNCKDCFGCTGLRSKRYCILNKQYTKEEYETLLPKIRAHMNEVPYRDAQGAEYRYGEFFPMEISPFYYNETISQEYFPVFSGDTKARAYHLKEKENRGYKIDIESKNLPDSIEETNDLIVGKTISCLHFSSNDHLAFCDSACTEAFKVTAEDLQFYKRLGVPLPRLCPNCRHYTRLSKRNPLKVWHRSCMCKEGSHGHSGICRNEFETSYAPERPEIIYCESCYQKEVM